MKFIMDAQEAVDSLLNDHLWDSLQSAVQAQKELQDHILTSTQSLSTVLEAVQTFSFEDLAPALAAAEKWGQHSALAAAEKLTQELVPALVAAEKWAQQLAPAFEAAGNLVHEREALASGEMQDVLPCSNVDWSAFSPRPHGRLSSVESEPSRERTIVRPEVKRKIGFRR